MRSKDKILDRPNGWSNSLQRSFQVNIKTGYKDRPHYNNNSKCLRFLIKLPFKKQKTSNRRQNNNNASKRLFILIPRLAKRITTTTTINILILQLHVKRKGDNIRQEIIAKKILEITKKKHLIWKDIIHSLQFQ